MKVAYLSFFAAFIMLVILFIAWMYMKKSTEYRVRTAYIGDPLSFLLWKGSGTRSYMLEYVPLSCSGTCLLARTWTFRPSRECGEQSFIIIKAGEGELKMIGKPYRKGSYCYSGAFLIISEKPIKLVWKNIEVSPEGKPLGEVEEGEDLIVVKLYVAIDAEGWEEPIAGVKVKEIRENPYIALIQIQPSTALHISYGKDLLTIQASSSEKQALLLVFSKGKPTLEKA
ncbi:MAG: hypothetical protein J7J67_02210 [Thermoproteales archaeon]|nr:hypothetical protein [Thermoproteales archaeon]